MARQGYGGAVRRGTLFAAVVALLLVLAPPALASGWERIADPAPGASPSLAVLGGVPYLATIAPDGTLTVSRGGTGWTPVGGPINHDPAQPASQPDLFATGSTLWLTWVEAGQVRVSKLVAGQWREPVGGARPINRSGTTGFRPRILVRSGVPYVAYMTTDQRLDVVRLNGDKFQHLTTGLSTAGTIHPELALLGNALYVGYNQGDFGRVSRFDDSALRWVTVSKTSGDYSFDDFVDGAGSLWYLDGFGVHRVSPGGSVEVLDPQPPVEGARSFAVVGGVRYAAGIHQPFDFMTGELRLAAFRSGAWQPLPSPADAGAHTAAVQLTRAGTTLWITWVSTPGDPEGPQTVHVARFVP